MIPFITSLVLFAGPVQAQDAPQGAGEASSEEVGALPRLPELLYAAPAAYPPEALTSGKEAVVKLEMSVSETGEVVFARSVEPVGDGFDEAAVLAARAFRFSPALDAQGSPATAVIQYNLLFSAEAAPPLSVEGQILEAGVRTPLAGVELTATAADGTVALSVTDAAGNFSFVGLTEGAWLITAEGASLKARSESVEIKAGSVIGLELFLTRDTFEAARSGDTILVEESRASSEITERKLSAEEIQYLPGTNGDVVKVVQNLPGVARPPWASASSSSAAPPPRPPATSSTAPPSPWSSTSRA